MERGEEAEGKKFSFEASLSLSLFAAQKQTPPPLSLSLCAAIFASMQTARNWSPHDSALSAVQPLLRLFAVSAVSSAVSRVSVPLPRLPHSSRLSLSLAFHSPHSDQSHRTTTSCSSTLSPLPLCSFLDFPPRFFLHSTPCPCPSTALRHGEPPPQPDRLVVLQQPRAVARQHHSL